MVRGSEVVCHRVLILNLVTFFVRDLSLGRFTQLSSYSAIANGRLIETGGLGACSVIQEIGVEYHRAIPGFSQGSPDTKENFCRNEYQLDLNIGVPIDGCLEWAVELLRKNRDFI